MTSVVSRRNAAIILSKGSVCRVMSDVILVIVDERGVPVRLMTMREISISMVS
jgi:hypothetical protein